MIGIIIAVYLLIGGLLFLLVRNEYIQVLSNETDPEIAKIIDQIGYNTVLTLWCIILMIFWPIILIKFIVKNFL